jgi:hypothetical protein
MNNEIEDSPAVDPANAAEMAVMTMSAASEPQSVGTDPICSVSNEAEKELSVPTETIAMITVLYRDRKFAMEQRKRAGLALGAYLRGALGWRKDLPEKERKAIAARAAAITKDPAGTPWETMVNAQVASIAPFEAVEKTNTKEMEQIARALPVWKAFGEEIRGFGAASLAAIIAEAGDLSNYDDKAKLWKRMGVAVLDGIRQGGLVKGAGAEAWIAHGYNPMRRSVMWNIGDTMLKAQIRKVKSDDGEDTGERTSLGKYGQSYLDRKVYELAREPEMQPIKAHRRAQRYMEKRLLKDLWQAWRRDRDVFVQGPVDKFPDAEPIAT